MKFLVDAHFPVRLKNWLVENGEDAIHTSDMPNKNHSSDLEIIQRATADNRIVVTKDSDFIKYRIVHSIPDRLLMVTTGNIVNKELIQLFEANFPTLKGLFEAGKKVIEIDNSAITVHE